METGLLIALSGMVGALITAGAAWLKAWPERRKIRTDTQSQIFEDLNKAYLRINDELLQAQMRVKVCEAENETCRKQIQDLQSSVGFLQVEMGNQSRINLLSRARSHIASKTLGNYELHIDFLLDEMRNHDVPITPMMRTQKLRSAFQAQMERLEAMELQELEGLLRQLIAEDTPTP